MSEEKKKKEKLTIMFTLEGENYQKFLRVSKKKGIPKGVTLFLHLLAEADPGKEMDVTTFMKQFCEDCVSKDTCNPKDASVCMYQQKGSA